MELVSLKTWVLDDANASLEEVKTSEGKFLGTRIIQDGCTYIARNWELTEEVKDILKTSCKVGINKFWRNNHPSKPYLLGGKKYLDGSHHISCSKEHDQPWVFAIGAESLSSHSGKQRVRVITFNKTYSNSIKSFYALNGLAGETSEIELEPGYFRVQRGSGYCYTTHPSDFKGLIEHLSINI